MKGGLAFLPLEVQGGERVALAPRCAGDPAHGERLIEPLRRFGRAYGEHIGAQPYRAWRQMFHPLLSGGQAGLLTSDVR